MVLTWDCPTPPQPTDLMEVLQAAYQRVVRLAGLGARTAGPAAAGPAAAGPAAPPRGMAQRVRHRKRRARVLLADLPGAGVVLG